MDDDRTDDSVAAGDDRRVPPPARRPSFTDPEKAREAGKKGGARKAELEKLKKEDPEEYMRQQFQGERAGLTRMLLDAAYGRGSFSGLVETTQECPSCGEPVKTDVVVPALTPDKRLGAISKALEYALGKPQAGKATGSGPAKSEEPPTVGLSVM